MHQILVAMGRLDSWKAPLENAVSNRSTSGHGFPELVQALTQGPADDVQSQMLELEKTSGEAAVADLHETLELVKGILNLATAATEAIADPAERSAVKMDFATSLVQFAADLQVIPLEQRQAIADQVLGDLHPGTEFLPLIQIVRAPDPIEKLQQLASASVAAFSGGVKADSPLPLASAAQAEGDAGPGILANLIVDTGATGKPRSLIPVPSKDDTGRPTALPLLPLEQTASRAVADSPILIAATEESEVEEGGSVPVAQRQGKIAPLATSSRVDPVKAATPSPAVGQAPPLAPQPEAAELRPTVQADAAVRAQAGSDPSPSFVLARSVAAQMRGQSFEDGKTRVELSPRGLGDVEVEVARDDFGKLRVVLRVENPAVLTAFRQDREALLTVLRDGGLDIDDRELGFEEFGGHSSQQHPSHTDAPQPMLRSRLSPELPDPSGVAPPQIPSSTPEAGLNIVT